MNLPRVAILHYSAAPTVGGVEAVISAHAAALSENGYPVSVIAGKGSPQAFPESVDFIQIPEMDTQHPRITALSASLESGLVPQGFEEASINLQLELARALDSMQIIILHNLFSKHFNLPLTVALYRLIPQFPEKRWICWSHDFTWTSKSSRSKVYPGFPWDLLRTYIPQVTYVTVSQSRKRELVDLLEYPADRVQVVYNGVNLSNSLGLSSEGLALSKRLDLFRGNLILLMPVRVTRAKNIELALKILAELKERGAHPRLVVSGPPDPHDKNSMAYFRQLQNLRSRLELESEMHFVWESGPTPGQPYRIGARLVGELLRICDVMLMPSHYEGFGMPVLEAGLAGAAVATTSVPAAIEIAGDEVILFELHESPQAIARKILDWSHSSRRYQLRRKIRKNYTWNAIFERDIRPMLTIGK
jgi:glycosyltransferase involved in cell wall biosynthesis